MGGGFPKDGGRSGRGGIGESAKLLQETLNEIISEAPELTDDARKLVEQLNADMTSASKNPEAFRKSLADMQFNIADLRLRQWQNNTRQMQMQMKRLRTYKPGDSPGRRWRMISKGFYKPWMR